MYMYLYVQFKHNYVGNIYEWKEHSLMIIISTSIMMARTHKYNVYSFDARYEHVSCCFFFSNGLLFRSNHNQSKLFKPAVSRPNTLRSTTAVTRTFEKFRNNYTDMIFHHKNYANSEQFNVNYNNMLQSYNIIISYNMLTTIIICTLLWF